METTATEATASPRDARRLRHVNDLELDWRQAHHDGVARSSSRSEHPRDHRCRQRRSALTTNDVVRPGDETSSSRAPACRASSLTHVGRLGKAVEPGPSRSSRLRPSQRKGDCAPLQLRTYLRIEAELVIPRDREGVATSRSSYQRSSTRSSETSRSRPADCPQTPDFSSAWASARHTVLEQPPMRRVIEFPRDPTCRIRAGYIPACAPVRGLRGGRRGRPDRYPLKLLPNEPDPLDRRSALSLVPAEHVGRRRRLPRLGTGLGPIGRRANRRLDRRLLGESLQPGSPSPSAAVLRAAFGAGCPGAEATASGTDPSIRPHLADDPSGRRLHGRRGRAGHSRLRRRRT